ncbi:hypothetical protein MPS_1958 [Mycobacterium pseudoshottsii JCM 15466]|nr:hypothetical protein MPS_1958 [Mycobacterium pseudoshottsii JCM 15466]
MAELRCTIVPVTRASRALGDSADAEMVRNTFGDGESVRG